MSDEKKQPKAILCPKCGRDNTVVRTLVWTHGGGSGRMERDEFRCYDCGHTERGPMRVKLEEPEDVLKLDCQDCGCCCRPLQDGMAYYARLTEEDEARLRCDGWNMDDESNGGQIFTLPLTGARHLTTFHAPTGTTCWWLTTFHEFTGTTRYSCDCYRARPQVCRDFTQGSRDCLGMRCYFLNPAVVELRRQYAMRGEFLKPFWMDVP